MRTVRLKFFVAAVCCVGVLAVQHGYSDAAATATNPSLPTSVRAADAFPSRSGISIVADSNASSGNALRVAANGTEDLRINAPTADSTLVIRARSGQCTLPPNVGAAVDGKWIGRLTVTSQSYQSLSYPKTFAAGTHNIRLYLGGHKWGKNDCNTENFLDTISFAGSSVVTVGAKSGATVPGNFVGLSMETFSTWRYFSPDTQSEFSSDVQRISDPNGPQIYRLGGNSTDETWYSPEGPAPRGTWVNDKDSTFQTLASYSTQHPSKFLVGVNLGSKDAANSAAFAGAAKKTLGASLSGLEIGNEPDGFANHTITHNVSPSPSKVRDHGYDSSAWLSDLNSVEPSVKSAASGVPVAGPAAWTPAWVSTAIDSGKINTPTMHNYPLTACGKTAGSNGYPTASTLLGEWATHSAATRIAPIAQQARAKGTPLVMSEVNSVSCSGAVNASDTLASALWSSDYLFELDNAGVGQVDFHSGYNALYTPLDLQYNADGTVDVVAKPEYYGIMAFKQAAPVGSSLLNVAGAPAGTKIWATRSADGTTRVMLINKSATAQSMSVAGVKGVSATRQVLSGSSLDAKRVSWSGQTVDSKSGKLVGASTASSVNSDALGNYATTLAPYSEVLLTIPAH